MKRFVANSVGGVDMYVEGLDTSIRLNGDDLKEILEVQQKRQDLDFVKGRVESWVEKQLAEDDGFFADFNSHLFSGDEISKEEIFWWIRLNNGLMKEIAEEYRDILEDPMTQAGCQEWWYADEAISTHVSIQDVMGEILREKHPKELAIGRWRVLLIEQGDLYGTESNRVPWPDMDPCVEFYDLYADKTRYPNGQFTTGRFYVDQLVHPGLFTPSLEELVEDGCALCLHPSIDKWKVEVGDLNVINAWLRAAQAHAQAKAHEKPLEEKIAEAKKGAVGVECGEKQGREKEGFFCK